MADIRLRIDEVFGFIKNAEIVLHGVRRDAQGKIIDHIDLALPLACRQMLRNLKNMDGVDYASLGDSPAGELI